MEKLDGSHQNSMRDLVKDHYTADYKSSLEDSPADTRRDVNRAVMQALREDAVHPRRILNIGSGPQLLERFLLQSYGSAGDSRLLKDTFFVTTDLADIAAGKLKAQKHANVSHIQGDAERLPFAPGSFGMVVSNMAIDMMPREAFSQAAEALAPGGSFVFTFHHPDMMRTILAETKDRQVREFVTQGLQSHLYFETEDEIKEILMQHGLNPQNITKQRDSSENSNDKWWFVKGVKIQVPAPLTTGE